MKRRRPFSQPTEPKKGQKHKYKTAQAAHRRTQRAPTGGSFSLLLKTKPDSILLFTYLISAEAHPARRIVTFNRTIAFHLNRTQPNLTLCDGIATALFTDICDSQNRNVVQRAVFYLDRTLVKYYNIWVLLCFDPFPASSEESSRIRSKGESAAFFYGVGSIHPLHFKVGDVLRASRQTARLL